MGLLCDQSHEYTLHLCRAAIEQAPDDEVKHIRWVETHGLGGMTSSDKFK